jgi:arylsulfatase A-like enzyme
MTNSAPNILLILVDQLRYDCLGVNGHPMVQTPNLNRLAAEGMNFSHAFTPSPVCVPARASLMTGAWATRHLAIANPDTEAPRPFSENMPVFSQLLREAGYWLGWVGKWQIQPKLGPLDYGFHQYIDDKEYGQWRSQRGLEPKPHKNSWFGEADPFIKPEESRLGWGAQQVIGLLNQTSNRPNRPFFIRWDPNEPHLPNIVPEPYASLYPPEKIEPWPGWGDTLEGKPFMQSKMRRTWGIDGWTWENWAPVVSRYLGEVSLMDAQVGRILDELDRTGLSRDTLVIFTTDHGDLCGSHGLIDKHYVMYDDVVHVPFIARWPGRIAPGSRSDSFVCHAIDLAATFCELAGKTVPDTFQGQSLVPIFEGGQNGREDILAMYQGNQFGLYSQRMLRGRRFKYVLNASAEDEFYDLHNDPGEHHNLAYHPEYASEISFSRHRLIAWMEEIKDPLLNEWVRSALEKGI